MAHQDILERRVYAPGDVIFKEGEVGRRCAFLIRDGRVEILKMAADGHETVLGHVGAGGIFGEMALVDDKPRMAMARAVEMTTVVIITEQALEAKLRKTDPFIRGLLNIFAGYTRDLAEKLAKHPS